MKTLKTFLSVACMLAIATAAFAQPEDGDLTLSFTADGLTPEGSVAAFTPTPFYVVGHNLGSTPGVDTVKGWELELVNLNPGMLVLSRTLDQPGSLNIGGDDNFIVGSGGCFDGAGGYVFVTYSVGWFSPGVVPELMFCAAASRPSSFDPPAPGYLRCDGSLVQLGVGNNGGGVYDNGCAVANPSSPGSIVSNVDTSWGAVKADF